MQPASPSPGGWDGIIIPCPSGAAQSGNSPGVSQKHEAAGAISGGHDERDGGWPLLASYRETPITWTSRAPTVPSALGCPTITTLSLACNAVDARSPRKRVV